MNDHQQRPSLPRQHTQQEEGEEWYDEQDGGVPIEEEVWPPRTRTSAVRCQATAHGAPPENSPVVPTTATGQPMQGVPARRTAIPQRSTATHQRHLPAKREQQTLWNVIRVLNCS